MFTRFTKSPPQPVTDMSQTPDRATVRKVGCDGERSEAERPEGWWAGTWLQRPGQPG
jgi:hypothetical protein